MWYEDAFWLPTGRWLTWQQQRQWKYRWGKLGSWLQIYKTGLCCLSRCIWKSKDSDDRSLPHIHHIPCSALSHVLPWCRTGGSTEFYAFSVPLTAAPALPQDNYWREWCQGCTEPLLSRIGTCRHKLRKYREWKKYWMSAPGQTSWWLYSGLGRSKMKWGSIHLSPITTYFTIRTHGY